MAKKDAKDVKVSKTEYCCGDECDCGCNEGHACTCIDTICGCGCGCGCDECCECDGLCTCPCENCTCEHATPLIGDKAPEFHANTTQGEIHFPNDYKGKWVILFSHPADFTPVCTTEFLTFASRYQEFKKQNCELVGLSIDSIFSHLAWLDKIKSLQYKDIKNVDIEFPLIDDIDKNVAYRYGMIHPAANSTQAVRAVFFIGPDGVIKTILYYPASVGRNFDELFRILTALQTVEKEKCATPADWQKGDDVIVPPATNMKTLKERKDLKDGMVCQDWFFCFKKTK